MQLQDLLTTKPNMVGTTNVQGSVEPNPATQPATNQQASSFDPQDFTVDKKKLIADVFTYTSSLIKNADVDASLAHYANTQEGGFTGKAYLDAAREKPSIIGMTEKDVDDNPIIAVRNVLGRNISEVAIDKYLEVYNNTKDISKADEAARMFINDNVKGLASFRPDVKDKSSFNDTFSRFAAEDFSKQVLGYRDTQSDKIYVTTMSQGMNSGLKLDSSIGNFMKSASASALGTEGLIEGIGSMMGIEWASMFRDQQKNQLVQDELTKKDMTGAVSAGEIAGTAAGIGLIIGEAYLTGGMSAAASATKTGATIARYAPQVLRAQAQDALDNDALAKKYFDGNALQKADYGALIASRTFDVVTAIGGDVLSAYAKGFVAQGGLKSIGKKMVEEPLEVSGAKLAANLSVWRGLKAATADVGVETAVDLIAHNTLAYALDDKVTGEKFFTEGQNISLGLENFDGQMSARYIGTKVFSRLFGGSMARIRELKANKQSQLVGKDYMIDDANRETALKGWQKLVKSFGNILEEDVLATEDMNIRKQTSANGGRPIGLREIFTDPIKDPDTGLTKAQTFEKQFGKNAIVNRYVANALGNNVFYSMFTNSKLNSTEEFIEAYNAPDTDYDIAQKMTDMNEETKTMDFSARNMNKKTDVLNEEEKNSAANIVINKFIPANATPAQFDKGVENLASFILNGNVSDVSSKPEDGKVTFYDRVVTALDNRKKDAGNNYDSVDPENAQKNRILYKNSYDKFNSIFVNTKVADAANNEYVKKLTHDVDDDYRKQEYDLRQELSKTFDVQDVNADYMKRVYDSRGDLQQRLDELNRARTSPEDKGTTHNFYKRLATTFMTKEAYDDLNEVNRSLANELSNLKDEPKGADDFIKLDNAMKQAGEQLLKKEFNKLDTIANATSVSENDRVLGLGAAARKIRTLSSIFGYKLMPALDAGYDTMTKETKGRVNLAFQKTNWLSNPELKTILANEFKSMDMTNEELQKNALQTFYSSLVTVSQKAFFEQRALTDAFKSPEVSRALHYAMYGRYTSPGSLNTKLAAQLSNMVLNVNNPAFTMLHENDNKTLIAMGYLDRMFKVFGNVTFKPNTAQKQDFANAIVNKSLGRYMVFEAPEKVFENDPDIDNIVTKAKLYIRGETGLEVKDGALTNILTAYLNKDSAIDDLSRDFDGLLDHNTIGETTDTGKLARAASNVIMGDNRRITKEIWESSADNNHIDYNSVFIVKSFDSDEQRSMNFVEVLNELTAKDSGRVNHVRIVQTIVNQAKSKQEALDNVSEYLKATLPSLGLEVTRTANSKDGKDADDAITRIAHNIIHDTFNKTHVDLAINLNAHDKASQFVMSMTNTGTKQNIFKGAYIVNMNTDEYNDLDKIGLNTLQKMGFLRVGQSGTGGSPLFIAMPGIDFSDKGNLLKVIKEFGIDSKLEESFEGYDKSIFAPLKNLEEGASENSIIDAFNKVKKDLSASLKEKLTASANELKAFANIKPAKLMGKVEYQYDLALDVNADSITKVLDRVGVIDQDNMANVAKEMLGIAGKADRNQPSGNALDTLVKRVDNIISTAKLNNAMDIEAVKELIDNQVVIFNTEMAMSQREGVKAKDSRLASNLIQQYQKFFEYESVNWLSKQDANELPKQIYDKIIKQIEAIGIKENDLKVKSTSDVLSQSVELLLFHEMFFTATDLQKRTSVGITASNPESARLVSGYESAVTATKSRTGREPRIVIVNGDYKSVAGALWFPKWVQDYYSTLSNNTDGNKLAIATDGSLMKLMVDPLANFRKILGDNEIMDSEGNRISNADIDDNDIVINFETWKSMGTGLLKALPTINVVNAKPDTSRSTAIATRLNELYRLVSELKAKPVTTSATTVVALSPADASAVRHAESSIKLLTDKRIELEKDYQDKVDKQATNASSKSIVKPTIIGNDIRFNYDRNQNKIVKADDGQEALLVGKSLSDGTLLVTLRQSESSPSPSTNDNVKLLFNLKQSNSVNRNTTYTVLKPAVLNADGSVLHKGLIDFGTDGDGSRYASLNVDLLYKDFTVEGYSFKPTYSTKNDLTEKYDKIDVDAAYKLLYDNYQMINRHKFTISQLSPKPTQVVTDRSNDVLLAQYNDEIASLKQQGQQVPPTNMGRAIVLKDEVEGKNVYKNFILKQLHIHSNIKDTANDTNAADQMMAADRAMGNYMAMITSSTLSKQIAKAESTIGLADFATDPTGAMKETHSAMTRTEKITGANPPVRIRTGAIDNNIGAVLNRPMEFGFNKERDSQITATQVGLRLPTMLQMLAKTKAYADQPEVRELYNQLLDPAIGNDLANHQDLVKRALNALSEGEQPLLGRIGSGDTATYFMFGVRFPAQNQGSATMHHLSYVANAKFGEGVEMDPFYMPMLNKADSDGDKFVVYPADVKAYYDSVNAEFKMTQNGWDDKAKVEDQKIAMLTAMSTHLSDSITKLMPIDDASVKALNVSDYLKSRDRNMELGLIVKLSTDNSIWVDGEYDAMAKAVSQAGLTLGDKIKDILFGNRKDAVVLDKVPDFEITQLEMLKKIKKDNNWVLLRKTAGGDQAPQGVGSMIGSLLPKKHLVFGGVAYKVLITTQGDQKSSTQTVYLLKSDSDDGEFSQTDFGMNAAIAFTIPNTSTTIPLMDRLKDFNHSQQMAIANQVYNRLSDTAKNQKISSLEDLIWQSYSTTGASISNNTTQFRFTSADRGYTEGQNTGTDAQKYQGLAHLNTIYGGDLLNIFDEVNMSILGSRAVLISGLSAGGRVTIGNIKTSLDQGAVDQLDAANVVKLILHAMDSKASVSRADFKAIKKIQSGKKYMELAELQASVNAVRNANLNNVSDEVIGQRYGHMFRNSYRILKMISNKQLGLGLIDGQLKDLDKTYLGGKVSDEVSKLYFDGLPKLTTVLDENQQPVEVMPLEAHARFNGMANAVAAVSGGTRYDARMTVMMALNSVHLPSTVDLNVKIDQEGLRDALVDKVYNSILANGKGSLATRDDVKKYLTHAFSNGMELSKAVVGSASAIDRIFSAMGVLIDFPTRLSKSPKLLKQLRDAYNADKKTVVRITKQGKPVSAGELIDHLNGLLSQKQSANLAEGDSFTSRNEVLQALLGTLGSETQNAAWLRKLGFNNAVSKKTIEFFGRTLSTDSNISTDYEFDKSIALDLKQVAFTEFNMSLDYMPDGLNKIYQTKADPCSF